MGVIHMFLRSFNRPARILFLVTLVIALQLFIPEMLTGNANQAGNVQEAAAASDPVIAAAGDIACDPANSAFKSG